MKNDELKNDVRYRKMIPPPKIAAGLFLGLIFLFVTSKDNIYN